MPVSSCETGTSSTLRHVHIPLMPEVDPPSQDNKRQQLADTPPKYKSTCSIRVLYKARDTIYCPCCRQNNNVFIDSEKHFATIIRSWIFDYYRCKACDLAFRQAGLPIVLPGSILFGISILVAANFVRGLIGI